MNNLKQKKAKDKKTAVILACIPWGILTWVYTYKKDKKKLFKNLSAVVFWLVVILGAYKLPETKFVEEWLVQNNIEIELSQLILLIVSFVVLALTIILDWAKALRKAIKRSETWYKGYPLDSKTQKK